jgi:hypothetical protein
MYGVIRENRSGVSYMERQSYEEVVLKSKEVRLLRRILRKKKLEYDWNSPDLTALQENGFIYRNVANRIAGRAVYDKSCSISDRGVRYLLYLRKDLYKRIVTPVTVSVLTSLIISYLFPLILQLLQSLLAGP